MQQAPVLSVASSIQAASEEAQGHVAEDALMQYKHIALSIIICDKVFILILRKSTHLSFMRNWIQIQGYFLND